MDRTAKPDSRESRLADALRANLRRRKQTSAPKRDGEKPAEPEPDEGGGTGEA